jgi:dephospho-CoA kinase
MEQEGAGLRDELISLLGEKIYIGNKVDRQYMAGIIFDNPDLLFKVNQIVHPRVAEDFLSWCHSLTHFPYVIMESAILIESDLLSLFDIIILVTAPEDVRIKRIINRPGMTREKIHAVMKNQLPECEKNLHADFVIHNDCKNLVLPQILNLHNRFMQSAEK